MNYSLILLTSPVFLRFSSLIFHLASNYKLVLKEHFGFAGFEGRFALIPVQLTIFVGVIFLKHFIQLSQRPRRTLYAR